MNKTTIHSVDLEGAIFFFSLFNQNYQAYPETVSDLILFFRH